MSEPVVVQAAVLLEVMMVHLDDGERLRTTKNAMFFSRHCKCGIKTNESQDRKKIQEDMFRHIIVEAIKRSKEG